MLTSPFFRRLFLPYLLLICVATGIVGFVSARHIRNSYFNQTTESLRHQAHLIARLIANDMAAPHPGKVSAQLRTVGPGIASRITIVDADGEVIADTQADPSQMDNHRLRPEIVAAAASGEGVSRRESGTVDEGMLYFARRTDGGPGGRPYYIRVAVHLRELQRHLQSLYASLSAAALLAILAAGILCFHFARRSTAPVVELTDFAESLSKGNLTRRVGHVGAGEIAILAAALNTMADSLSHLIGQSAKDKAELLAILSGMNEGVIAIDSQLKVLLVNAAAGSLLGFSAEQAQGKFLWELVRSEPILRTVGQPLSDVQQDTFQVGPLFGRYLEVTACPFPASAPQGIVLVIHDATETVRYQELRKEFVANVSHELRTPLTAIKGFTETLRDGAMADPERAPKYLATIEKHADQLSNLVTDLLELSRLDSHPGLPGAVAVDVPSVVRRTADLLKPVAERKRQTLRVDIAPNVPVIDANPDYLERAVANLLENAIKYTPDQGQVDVSVATTDAGDALHIKVADNGIGIPAEDLPRIFERFYRVDRSRSREMGGTGLGLSIVKHVAQVHGGSVEVSSTPGQGSTFTLKLPLSAA